MRCCSGTLIGAELLRGERDEKTAVQWRNVNVFFFGSGTKEDPFATPAADHSPHFGVFEMWFVLRNWQSDPENPIFIQVNDWIFTVTPEGVTAEDGVFTFLLPSSGSA